MNKSVAILVYGGLLLFFAAFLLWPIWQILQGAFWDPTGNLSLAYFAEVLRNPLYLSGLKNSLLMGVYSTLVALLIALPLAWIADRYEFRWKRLLMVLVILPVVLPPFVGAIGIKQILGQSGAFNALLETLGLTTPDAPIDWLGGGEQRRFWVIILINALGLYPIVYLNASAALSSIDPAMEEAAANMGCPAWKRFFLITLPLIRPGLFAGCTIVFIWAFTELGVPLLLDYSRVTSVQIFYGLGDIGGNPFPYALVAVMLVASMMFYALGKGLFGRKSYATVARANHARVLYKPGVWGQIVCISIFGGTALLALLPHLGVILVSFSGDWYRTILPDSLTLENYRIALSHPLTIPSIRNSLLYASLATMLNLVIGILIAFIVVRSRLPGRGILDVLAMVPLAVPGLVIAFGYLAMSQDGKLFDFINPVENPLVLLVIAYAVRKVPFVVRSTIAGLQQTSVTYEEAAQNLGSTPWKAAWRITLPLILANLLAGALLAFSQSMLEVADSLILAQKSQYYPITKAIYELVGLLGDGRFVACALGVWAMTFLAIAIWGAYILLGRRLGAVFRI
jgi:iron(III) transport system permease protein